MSCPNREDPPSAAKGIERALRKKNGENREPPSRHCAEAAGQIDGLRVEDNRREPERAGVPVWASDEDQSIRFALPGWEPFEVEAGRG